MPITLPCSAVRELDRAAITDCGVLSLLLMENAGRACADVCCQLLEGAARSGPVLVLAGPGNNGGDGFVVARTLHNRGVDVRLFFIGDANDIGSLSSDTRENARLWCELSPLQTLIESPSDFAGALETSPSLIVDGMFGTGLTRDLRSPWSEVVALANESAAAVLAVDIPSGLHGDTGEVLGVAIRASHTVSFVVPKPGLFLRSGPAHVGHLTIAEIGIPRRLIDVALRNEGVSCG